MPKRATTVEVRPDGPGPTLEAVGNGLVACALLAASVDAFAVRMPMLAVPLMTLGLLCGLVAACAGREVRARRHPSTHQHRRQEPA